MYRVVVTGMGAVTPIGNSVAEYWQGLCEGKNGIAPITKFDADGFKCKIAAEVKNFDPSGVLDKSAIRKTDDYVQYALCAAVEAFNESGLEGCVDTDMLGVYLGSGVGGINTLLENEIQLLEGGPRKVSPQFIPKMIINIAAGQLAIRFNAHGTALALSTACATGTNAIGEAYRAIKDGYLTAALCGGSEATINPLTVSGFINCMALTQSDDADAASLPFDRRRGGFVLGEGAGVLVLEEYEHARSRNAHIYAEITGYGSTCDAYHITAPAPDAQYTAKAIAQSVAGMELHPEKIYINAHGTGTKLNDTTETLAIKKVFGEGAGKLHISSTKSMTGHALGAAGAIEAIACLKALETGIIPPTINLNEPDPECDLNYTPNKAVRCDIDTALSTSLGFGGHNACIVFKKLEGHRE